MLFAKIWLAAYKPASNLCMWKAIFCGACFHLSMWWISIYPLQLNLGFNCESSEPALQRLDCEPLQHTTANRQDIACSS